MAAGGLCQWELKVKGKLCHSGFPNKGVNALELASDLIIQVQKKYAHRSHPDTVFVRNLTD
jgi:metal-dependent amidase/aminoacylase/carboxypeptidase family protein